MDIVYIRSLNKTQVSSPGPLDPLVLTFASSGYFCHLLITYLENSLDSDQAGQYVVPDLDPTV